LGKDAPAKQHFSIERNLRGDAEKIPTPAGVVYIADSGFSHRLFSKSVDVEFNAMDLNRRRFAGRPMNKRKDCVK